MRVLILTVAFAAISHAHLIPLAARGYNADEWQQIQDETREAAEELANKLEEAKWDALDKAWDVADHIEQDNYAEKTTVELPNQYAPVLIRSNPVVTHQVVHELAPAKQTIVAQSLSQTHPGSNSHIAAPVFEIGQPAVAVAPATKTSVVTQSLSQTHPAPYSGRYISAPALELSQPAIQISQPALALSPVTKTSVVTQSLSQTHPPSSAQGYAISQPAVEYLNPVVEVAHPSIEISQPAVAISPATKTTVVTQSLSQSHPSSVSQGHAILQPAIEIAQPAVEIAQPALAISPASKTTVVTQSLSQSHPPSIPQGHAIVQPALELTVPAVEYEFKHAYPSLGIAPAAIIQPGTKTVVTQSLDQTHPETWPKAEITW